MCIHCREATFVSSVAELVHDVIPQQASSGGAKDHERVEWISFQSADLNGKPTDTMAD
jgi:hypothetical protein